MSYDTDHVQNAGTNPEALADIRVFTELVDNPDLATIYTRIRRESPTTAPDLLATVGVSKKTVYEYLRKLEQAGLITAVGDDGGATTYDAEAFELTLTVRDVTVSITPALVEVLGRRDEYPVVDRVLDEDGLTVFALAYDLVTAHSDGDITIRQIADLTGLSAGTTYDLVEALYEIRALEDGTATPQTYTPADFGSGQADSDQRPADDSQ